MKQDMISTSPSAGLPAVLVQPGIAHVEHAAAGFGDCDAPNGVIYVLGVVRNLGFGSALYINAGQAKR
jgi:hypothetical protein